MEGKLQNATWASSDFTGNADRYAVRADPARAPGPPEQAAAPSSEPAGGLPHIPGEDTGS